MKLLSYLVEWSLRNRIIIIVISLLFILYSLYSAYHLKIDAVPDITTVQIQIVTTSPSLSALEIEQYITFPVERSMGGLPELEEVRSISRYGISMVTVVFKDSMDILRARQLVSERLIEAGETIPKNYGVPVMGPISTGLGEIFQFTLYSDRHSMLELTTYLNWNINPILKTVKGVVEVNTFGGNEKQYQVHLDLDKMQSMSISANDVLDTIRKNNISIGGGYIEHNKEYYVVSLDGLINKLSDLEKLIVSSTNENIPITLSEIAKMKFGKKLQLGATTQNGEGKVVGAIAMMLMNENSLETSNGVKEKLKEISNNLPEGMKINIFYDRSVMVKDTIKTVMINLIEGAILVIIILFIFLGNIRAGLVVAVVIPIAMLFAIFIMKIRDFPANLMSMGAIDFGLIVDGAVIIVENSIRRISIKANQLNRELNQEEMIQTVKDATLEVRRATIFGEIIIAIVYLPILTLSGIEGKMFKPMALTVLYALIGAFILSLTLVPVLSSYFLKIKPNEEHDTKLFVKIKKLYEPLLFLFIKKEKSVLLSLFVTFLLTMIVFFNIGAEFIPKLNEGSLLLEVGRLPSTSLSQSVETGTKIEKLLLKKFKEVSGAVTRTGSPDVATDPMGLERSDVYLSLIPQKDWSMSREKLIQELHESVEEILPEVSISISQPIEMRTNELIAGIRSDVGIKIFGDELPVLKKLGEEVASKIKNIDGIVDIKIEQLDGLPYIKIKPNRTKLAFYGISVQDLAEVIEMTSAGYTVGHVFEGSKRFEISVLIDKEYSQNINRIKDFPILSKNKISIPLSELADIVLETGPVIIGHEGQYRRILVEFNIRGRDMISAVNEIKKVLDHKIKLPDGYRFEYGGKYENYLSARSTLLLVVPITLALIFSILWLAFREIAPSLLILLNVPFSITGGILFLFLRGMPFSISAGIGFIALFGIAVLNGLVLISFTKELENDGMDKLNSILESAKLRVRPVLTTATVAAIGFIPMAISTNPGAEVQRPLATVVIGGILSSTILTLLVLPVIYRFYYKKRIL